MVLLQNGEIANTGVGAAVQGSPATCVAWLANRLADYDITLKAGEIILSGALSGMVLRKQETLSLLDLLILDKLALILNNTEQK